MANLSSWATELGGTPVFPNLIQLPSMSQKWSLPQSPQGTCAAVCSTLEPAPRPSMGVWWAGEELCRGNVAQVIPLPGPHSLLRPVPLIPCTGASPSCGWLPGPCYILSQPFLRTFLILRDRRLFCSQSILPTPPLNCHSEKKEKTCPKHIILEVSSPFLFQSELSETTF